MTNIVAANNGVGLEMDKNTYSPLKKFTTFNGPNPQQTTDVVVDSKGNMFVGWMENTPKATIYMRKFNTTGTPMTPIFSPTTNTSRKFYLNLIMTPKDDVIALWEDQRTGQYHLMFQKFDSSGNTVGNEIQITNNSVEQIDPAVSHMENNKFVVTWLVNNGPECDIYARVFDVNGTNVSKVIAIKITNTNKLEPHVEMDRSGHFLVVWTQYGLPQPLIYAQRFDLDGSKNGTELSMESGVGFDNENAPDVSVDSKGFFIVAWSDYDGTHEEVVAQRIGPDGLKSGPRIQVTNLVGFQGEPSVATESDGTAVITWIDGRTSAQTALDIYGRCFDIKGNPLGSDFLIDGGPKNQIVPTLYIGPDDNLTVAWDTNTTDPNYDGRAATFVHPRISDGTLITPNLSIANLTAFGSFVATWNALNASGNHIWFNYSTTNGATWSPVPANNSLSGVSITYGMIMFRATFNTTDPLTTPILYKIKLDFTTNSVPQVSAGKDFSVYRNQVVKLNGTAKDDDGDPITLQWAQVQGPNVTLIGNTTLTPTFVPKSSGKYGFALIGKDQISRSAPSTVSVTVVNRAPTVIPGPDLKVWKRGYFYLNATGTDPDGDLLNFSWIQVAGTFPYITQKNGSSIRLFAAAVGQYQFTIRASDGEAFSDIRFLNVTVVGRPPIARFTVNATVLQLNGTILVDGSGSTDPDGNVSGYLWEFGDGHSYPLDFAPRTLHKYTRPGNYSINLTVKDDDGNISDKVSTVIRVNSPPIASFVTIQGNYTIPYKFTSKSIDPDGTITQTSWDFGDGTSGSGTDVTHQYTARGEYTVKLKVTDNDGATVTYSGKASMKNRLPVILAVTPLMVPNITVGDSVKLKITAIDPDGDNLTYDWSADQGLIGTNKGNTIKYSPSFAGNHNVSVRISDGHGGVVSFWWAVTVKEKPKGLFNNGSILVPVLLVIVVIIIMIIVVVALLMRKKKARPAVQPPAPQPIQAPQSTQSLVQVPQGSNPTTQDNQQGQYENQVGQQYQQSSQYPPPPIS